MQGEMHLVRKLAEQVERICENSPDAAAIATSTALTMVAGAFAISGEIARAAAYLRRASDLPPSSNKTPELHGAAFHAQSLGWAERYAEARHQLTTLLHTARRLGSPTILAFALAISAEIGWWSGQWTTAYADATEALQWATENGQPGLLAYGYSMLARIDAARGARESCQARVKRAKREVEPRGVAGVPVYTDAALGLSALGAGELSDAAEKLQQAWDLALRQGVNNPNVFPIAGDLAEALARAGEFDGSAHILNWLDERAEATGLAYPHATACRARGILTDEPEEAQRLLLRPSLHWTKSAPSHSSKRERSCVPGRRCAATAVLPPQGLYFHRALGIFDGLGARPWAARATAELAASGVKDRRVMMAAVGPNRLDELSPQEFQVARIAARGQNNNEVAAALFVSRKTVEAHLTRVYRKLGIRSRTELVRILLANGIAD